MSDRQERNSGSLKPKRRGGGFKRTSVLVAPRVKGAGAKRGFAVARLLTHWAEIVGDEIAGSARPVDIKYGREGFGATLTLLVRGAEAPLLEMQKDRIRERVNACYGYNAIQRIRFTQTAKTGFAEAQTPFSSKPQAKSTAEPPAGVKAAAADVARPIEDASLRQALEALGQHILSPSETAKKRSDR